MVELKSSLAAGNDKDNLQIPVKLYLERKRIVTLKPC